MRSKLCHLVVVSDHGGQRDTESGGEVQQCVLEISERTGVMAVDGPNKVKQMVKKDGTENGALRDTLVDLDQKGAGALLVILLLPGG